MINKKILASIFVIGILALAMGYGTYSYFSDTAKSTGNTFTAGTLDLKLWGSSWEDNVIGTWVSPTDWAPGETYEATLYMTNTGSVAAKLVGIHGENLGGTGLADAVLLTKIVYTEGGVEYDVTSYYIGMTGMDANSDGKVTLSEFITWSGTYSMAFWTGDWGGAENYLPPEQHLILGFTFDSAATNWYQGKTATFDLVVGAYQSWAQYTLAGKGSGCYGYGN